jgi:hypothetical protein
VAGYEQGIPKLAELKIDPQGDFGQNFVPMCDADGSKELHACVAGITDVAEEALEHPETNTNDPVLESFRRSYKLDKGATLSLEEMESLADDLESRTSFKHRTEVGGPQQIVVLQKGATINYSEPILGPRFDYKSFNLIRLSNDTFGSRNRARGACYMRGFDSDMVHGHSASEGYMITDSLFENQYQLVDNTFTAASDFTNCVLRYNGSPYVLFDKTNRLIATTLLELGPDASIDDPFVKQMKEDFPSLVVITYDKIPDVFWP